MASTVIDSTTISGSSASAVVNEACGVTFAVKWYGEGYGWLIDAVLPNGSKVGFTMPFEDKDTTLLRSYTEGNLILPKRRGGYENQWMFQLTPAGSSLEAFGDCFGVHLDLSPEETSALRELLLTTPQVEPE